MIIYAAISGPNGGIWRSENAGQTWTQVIAGNATSVILDQDSGIVLDPSTGTDVKGNYQLVYAGIVGPNGAGDSPNGSGTYGVYISPNQGQGWTPMSADVGNPLIVDLAIPARPNVNPPFPEPVPVSILTYGKIVLASPAPPAMPCRTRSTPAGSTPPSRTPAAASKACT